MARQLLILLFTSVLVFAASMPLFAQETPSAKKKANATKQARWEGVIIRSNKDKSALTVSQTNTHVEKTVLYGSSTKWTSQEHGSKKVNQIKEFLLNAKVVKSQRSKKGITNPWRLTLSDGRLTHDASFQPIDEHATKKELTNGVEFNFVDSYKYNIAAYALVELLGIDDIVPVYVERKWNGAVGSLSWWLPAKMDEVERHKRKLTAPDADAWNNQMYKIRVLDQLVYDTDVNLTKDSLNK